MQPALPPSDPSPSDPSPSDPSPFDLPPSGPSPEPLEPGSRFPVDGPAAAFLAVASSAPPDFDDGVVVVLLDGWSRPVVAVAVDGAPEDDLTAACDLVARVRLLPEADEVRGCVLGVYRPADGETDGAVAVGPGALGAWADASAALRAAGVELLDVMVVEQTRWMSAWENAGFGARY